MSENKVIKSAESILIHRKAMYPTNIFAKNNKVWINGVIEDEFEYSHTFDWEKFYKTKVKVPRVKKGEDHIPIIVSEYLITGILAEKVNEIHVEIGGEFRSRNEYGEDGKRHLKLFIFANIINIYENKDQFEEVNSENAIYLDGYICKQTVYRVTPLGNRITDYMIAVKGRKVSYYIPCIAWEDDAVYASKLKPGNRVRMYGRVQSRTYSKEGENREVYEISTEKITKVEEQVEKLASRS